MFVYCSLDFQANFKLTVARLCNDFCGDVEFRFSLGWQAILREFLGHLHAEQASMTLTALLLSIVGGLVRVKISY